jgi:hypothetical protein
MLMLQRGCCGGKFNADMLQRGCCGGKFNADMLQGVVVGNLMLTCCREVVVA